MNKFDEIQLKTINKHILLNVDWELTYRCNSKCLHCYQEENNNNTDLSYEEVCSVINQLADMGALFISFTGGEVLLREDFFEIAKYARAKGFALRVFTNGILVDVDVANKLKSLNPLSVEISLYAMDPKIHDEITQTPGSHEKTIHAIKLLIELGVHVNIKSPMMSINIHEITKIENFAKETGTGFVYYFSVTPKVNGDTQICQYCVDIDVLREQFKESGATIKEEIKQNKRRSSDSVCSAGLNTMHITPQGDVFPCLMLRHNCGNVLNQNVEDIWQHPNMTKMAGVTVSDLKYCGDCEYVMYCNRCSGIAELESGDWLGVSKRECDIAKLRKELAAC